MQEEIKKILDYLKNFIEEDRLEQINLNRWFIISLLDYITNLQIIEREYSAVLSENAELQNLCDKYEEEHNTTFEEWKKNLKNNKNKINELKLNNYNKKLEIKRLNKQRDKFKNKYKYLSNSLKDYKSRNEKIIEFCNYSLDNPWYSSERELLGAILKKAQGVDKE